MKITQPGAFCAIFISLAPLPTLAQEVPTPDELVSFISAPPYWEIQDFRVVASKAVGDPISPREQVRFEADVSPINDLFLPATPEGLGPFVTVIMSVPDADVRTLYGTMDLTFQAGEWTGSVNIENSLAGLGEPQDMFTAPTLVLGSDQQQQVAELLSSSATIELSASLAATRQAFELQAQQELDTLNRDHLRELSELETAHEIDIANWQAKQSSLASEQDTKLAEVAADLMTQTQDLTEAHKEDVAALTLEHAERMRALLIAQENELTEKTTTHAQKIGELAAKQEQEIAMARAGYVAILDVLNARIATSEEILSKQQQLIEQSSQILENEKDIATMIAEKSAGDEAAMSDLLGTWSGTVNCYHSGEFNLWPVNFKAENVVGKQISGDFQNEKYGDRLTELATLTINSDNLVPPLSMTLRISNNAIKVRELDLELTPGGLIIGESVEQLRGNDGSVCQDIQLSKVAPYENP